MKKTIVAICLLTSMTVFSQWECRSNLTGHLKPISEGSNINWAAEVNGSAGMLSENSFANSMAFLGVDYTKNNHQIFFEGGAKYWYEYDTELSSQFSNAMLGLRELSYNYFSQKTVLNLGLQQMQLADFILVNERAWGGSISHKIGNLHLQLNAATVTKDFARNGTFCANCYLYDIVPSRTYPLGNTWGETNFAGFSFKKKIDNSKSSSTNDEFSEFADFESFDDVGNESKKLLQSYGGFLYSEFGTYYNETQLFAGVSGEFSLWNFANLKAQGIYQNVSNNNALLIYLKGERSLDWKSGDISTFNATFLGKINIDENATAMPHFSNLFMGEVLRMDMADMPLINVSAKHRFVDKSLSCKLAYTKQLKGLNMEEANLSISKNFINKHLKTTLITGFMNSDELNKTYGLAKIEMRVFF
ncbi:hypothetical protein OAO55_01720 [Bacteroidales bacterium]|nr:hypothetical protein [Bacteroidales bacterium]